MVLIYTKPNNSIKDRGAVDKSTVNKKGCRIIRSRKRGSRRRHQAKDVLGKGSNSSLTVAILRSAIIIVNAVFCTAQAVILHSMQNRVFVFVKHKLNCN